MATTVKDIIEGASVSRTPEGINATRIFQVSELSGNPTAILFNALITSGIPQLGDPHPSVPNVNAVDFNVTPNGEKQAIVSVIYKPPIFENKVSSDAEVTQIEVGSTVQSVETNFDVDGNELVVEHKELAGTVLAEDAIKPQLATVEKQIPMTLLRLSRRELGDPLFKSRTFVGTVNDKPFINDPAKFWLCTGIQGANIDGGKNYNVVYEFQRNPDTWGTRIIVINSETGRPPTPLVEGEGFKDVEVYETTDFNQLNLGLT